MTLDDLTVTMAKLGAGRWRLEIEGSETVEVRLEDVDVGEDRGFHAEGRNEEQSMRYELTTGPQPGGPIQVRRRPLSREAWEELGALRDAAKLG
jgi:hypothetical protein